VRPVPCNKIRGGSRREPTGGDSGGHGRGVIARRPAHKRGEKIVCEIAGLICEEKRGGGIERRGDTEKADCSLEALADEIMPLELRAKSNKKQPRREEGGPTPRQRPRASAARKERVDLGPSRAVCEGGKKKGKNE